MLLNLHVKNLAIIQEVEVDFSEHLNILTGETGAGKSILIGSMNIALGGKVYKDMIRKGAEYALVELVFQTKDLTLEQKFQELDIPLEDGQILISRKLTNGKSISRVNGQSVTAATLREIAGFLIDIHGQHEHQSLLNKTKHLEIVDHYAKGEIEKLKEEVNKYYEKYIKVKKELETTTISEEQRLREMSFLEYEINEIKNANLKEGEEEELSIIYRKLSNCNIIAEGISQVYNFTGEGNNSASECVGRSVRMLGKLTEYDEKIAVFLEELEEIENLLNDFNRELSNYTSELTFDHGELLQVEERLDFIRNLKAKYGDSVRKIQEYYQNIKIKMEQYQNYEIYIENQKKELEENQKKLEECCEKLSIIRKEKALVLRNKIKKALEELNFLDIQFEIKFRQLEKYSNNGYDEIEFLISTNPGEEIKPLSRVASGGELSRIMLAIKSVLADNDEIETLIFDEIDTGISGRTAQKVSEKLSFIAKNHQVICITHLPQIAAMADSHYIIEKKAENEITSTSIRKMKEKEVIQELARMLGGAKITEAVLHSAKEMKELASNTKIY